MLNFCYLTLDLQIQFLNFRTPDKQKIKNVIFTCTNICGYTSQYTEVFAHLSEDCIKHMKLM